MTRRFPAPHHQRPGSHQPRRSVFLRHKYLTKAARYRRRPLTTPCLSRSLKRNLSQPGAPPILTHRVTSEFFAAAIVIACNESGGPTSPTHEADSPSFIRTVDHLNTVEDFQLTLLSTCTGEDVALAGVLHHAVTVVDDGIGILHVTDQATIGLTGTGLTTGAQYLSTVHDQFNFNAPNGSAQQFTQTGHETLLANSRGAADNTLFSFDEHIVVTGRGEVKVTVDNFNLVCRG